MYIYIDCRGIYKRGIARTQGLSRSYRKYKPTMCDTHIYRLPVSTRLNGQTIYLPDYPDVETVYLHPLVGALEGIALRVNGTNIAMYCGQKDPELVHGRQWIGLYCEDVSGSKTIVFSVKNCQTHYQGDVFRVELEENPTTGYQWVIATTPGLNILHSEYTTSCPNDGTTGCGGVRTWTLQAQAPGVFEFRGNYIRPWERHAPLGKHSDIVFKFDILPRTT